MSNFTSFAEQSKRKWGKDVSDPDLSTNFSTDQLILGCLQRIAASLERIADNIDPVTRAALVAQHRLEERVRNESNRRFVAQEWIRSAIVGRDPERRFSRNSITALAKTASYFLSAVGSLPLEGGTQLWDIPWDRIEAKYGVTDSQKKIIDWIMSKPTPPPKGNP